MLTTMMTYKLLATAGLIAVILIAAPGCTTPTQLQYPDGTVVQCGSRQLVGSPGEAWGSISEGQCIHDHMAQGARRL